MNNSPNVAVRTKARRFARNVKGTALVEFALTLPFLAVLYLGCAQICDAVSVYRKTTTTSRTIVDLTSLQTQVSDAALTDILENATQIMAPYATTNLRMVVMQVTVSAAGVAKVDWTGKSGASAVAPALNSTYTLPPGVGVPNTSLIVAEVNYDYNADFGGLVNKQIPLGDITYMYPRSITKIPKV